MSYILFNGDMVFINKVDFISRKGPIIIIQLSSGNQIKNNYKAENKAKIAMENIATQIAIS
tara:strand:- start:4238 stop:4420 length:183 start_codon:yes stop_codon:yes gene_type:complete